MKKTFTFPLIITLSLLSTACAVNSGRTVMIVDATVLSSEQFCSKEEASDAAVLAGAAGGALIGSQLGGGKMKVVNAAIGGVLLGSAVKNSKGDKTNCNQFVNLLEYDNPYTGYKMRKQLVTDRPIRVGHSIKFETVFDNPYHQ